MFKSCINYGFFSISGLLHLTIGKFSGASVSLQNNILRHIMLIMIMLSNNKSLLRRLQAQTLPDATPPLGKIPPSLKPP